MVGLFIIKGTAMPSNAKSLSDVKDQLYRIFNKAVDIHDNSSDWATRKEVIERMQSVAKTIQGVEHQIGVQDFLKAVREEGGSIAFETGPDGATKISVLNPIRLKGSANAP
jgi:hypothetical protein